jgi:hemolysin III
MLQHEPHHYSAVEEMVHCATHAVGSHLGAAMLTLMVVFGAQSESLRVWKVVSGSIFGATIILLYSMSSIYHALPESRFKNAMEVCDHIAIYFLIAGSYTPIVLVGLRPHYPVLAWAMFGVVWGMALVGVVLKLFTTGRYRVISTLAYVAMGWIAVIGIGPIIRVMDAQGIMWLVLGGALYTLGTIFYIWHFMPFHHAVWHLFVMAGTICHFFCIFFSLIMK